MDENDFKFLNTQWHAYEMVQWNPPNCPAVEFSLLPFLECFEILQHNYHVQCTPMAVEYLLCLKMDANLKPEVLHKVEAHKKNAQSKKKLKKKSVPAHSHATASGQSLDELSKLPKINVKICLDAELQLLYTSLSLSSHLKNFLKKCLGIDSEEGELNFIGVFKGDPRIHSQFKMQKGVAGDKVASLQALFEHEHIEALQLRGRYFGQTVLGPVTKTLGAMPDNFPRITTTNVFLKNAPLRLTDTKALDVQEAQLEEVRNKLSETRVDEMTLQLSSPSLFHLYYNSSQEQAMAPPDPEPLGAEGIRALAQSDNWGVELDSFKQLKKIKVDGVVKSAPPFLQRIRSSALLDPVQEYV